MIENKDYFIYISTARASIYDSLELMMSRKTCYSFQEYDTWRAW